MIQVPRRPSISSRPRARRVLTMLAAALVSASLAHAADPEATCLRGRYEAAAKYAGCVQKAMGKGVPSLIPDDRFQSSLSRCRVKYTSSWVKLQVKAAGTGVLCDNERYDSTSAPGRVVDRLTGLEWEIKTNDASVHDAGNTYGWGSLAAANGDVFTTFLKSLNTVPCWGGQCDWRLPTIAELQTILLQPYPCSVSPCIDDVFGPTFAHYWSSTSHAANGILAFEVNFMNQGHVGFDAKNATYLGRAVRGGL